MDMRYHFLGNFCDLYQYGRCYGTGEHGFRCPRERHHLCVLCQGFHPIFMCRRWRQFCRRRVVSIKLHGMPDQSEVCHQGTPAGPARDSAWDDWTPGRTWW